MLSSRAIMKDVTRVRSPWKASCMQVEHQLDVLFPVLRHADRRRRRLDAGLVALLLGLHDAALDLAHVVEILGRARVCRAAPSCSFSSCALSRTASRMLVFCSSRARRSCRRRAVAAEHALEHDARVDLHRQRLRRPTPSDRAHVRAEEVAGAAAEVARVILGRELHRRERRIPADLLRDDLIDRRSRASARCPSTGTCR